MRHTPAPDNTPHTHAKPTHARTINQQASGSGSEDGEPLNRREQARADRAEARAAEAAQRAAKADKISAYNERRAAKEAEREAREKAKVCLVVV